MNKNIPLSRDLGRNERAVERESAAQGASEASSAELANERCMRTSKQMSKWPIRPLPRFQELCTGRSLFLKAKAMSNFVVKNAMARASTGQGALEDFKYQETMRESTCPSAHPPVFPSFHLLKCRWLGSFKASGPLKTHKRWLGPSR